MTSLTWLDLLPVGKRLFTNVTNILTNETQSPKGKIKKSEIRDVLLSVFDLTCSILEDFIINDDAIS